MTDEAKQRDLLEEKRVADQRFDDEVRAYWRFRSETQKLLVQAAEEKVTHAR